ncbi:unnamed protein product [Porites evermanni]|uniref:Low-density lipoprotein receptor-related protein 6 n=1 Tax=Porites evermanni TaxID=104178 RepID=A0ABN8PDI7_9CNID|nr:unnamed protein product [Porites evermanni]
MRTLLFMLFVTTVETQISTTKDTPHLRSVLPWKAPEDAEIQAPEAFLLYSNRKDIRRVSLDTNNDSLIPLVGVKEAYALDFNVQEMQIYWTDTSLRSINRAFLNGSQIEHLIVVDVPHPDGLAVDWIAKNLYWTDSKHQRIEVARLNGQHRKMLIWRDLWKPRELTVNPVSGHMYWANGGREPTIERADLDGSNRHTMIGNVTRPTGLTIDYSLGLIFWADIENQVIECANLDGTNRRVVASGLPKPFALTQYKDYIYWTDHALNSIYRANKTNGLDQTRIKSHTDDITDILVFHSSRRQEGWNSCARHNGGCSHLCLAKPGKRMVCSCPTHYTLSSTDDQTCNAPRVFMLFSTTTDIRRVLFNSSDNLEVVLPVRGLTDVVFQVRYLVGRVFCNRYFFPHKPIKKLILIIFDPFQTNVLYQ